MHGDLEMWQLIVNHMEKGDEASVEAVFRQREAKIVAGQLLGCTLTRRIESHENLIFSWNP